MRLGADLFRSAFASTVLAALASQAVGAQTLQGVLVDDASGDPIVGAQVSLLAEEGDHPLEQRITDQEGRFTMEVDFGVYRMQADRIGYASTVSLPFEVSQLGDVDVEFRINVEAVTMLPLFALVDRVPGRELFASRRELGRGLHFDPAKVDSLRPEIHAGEIFKHHRTMLVRWSFGRDQNMKTGPIPRVGTHFGSRRFGCFHWIVDRTLVAPPDFPFESFSTQAWATPPLSEVGPEDLVAIEIYRNWSEVPDDIVDHIEIGDVWARRELRNLNRKACGVVVIWTDRGWD